MIMPSIEEMISYLESAGYKVEKRSPGRVDSSFLGWEMVKDVRFDSASASNNTVNQLRLDVAIAKQDYHSKLTGNKQQEPTASTSATTEELRVNAERARLDANNIKPTNTAKPQSLEQLRLDVERARLDMISSYRS